MAHRILIIEDQEATAVVLQEYLNDQGFIAEVATNGRDAIKKFQAKVYDVLITDFKLPDVDGIEVVNSCKKLSPTVRVIYLTGYNLQLRRQKIKTGPDCQIIEKPCRLREILNMLKEVLSGS